jgi:hypothetical protein
MGSHQGPDGGRQGGHGAREKVRGSPFAGESRNGGYGAERRPDATESTETVSLAPGTIARFRVEPRTHG